jgi:methylenetetrahydrofolate reductase (NADPH)
MIRDRAHLADVLARARASGLREAFVVGGDTAQHTEFRDGVALLQVMEEMGHPFERIGVPAYPEGHADIPDDVLVRALKAKQPYAHSMTTQMSFNATAVSAWIGRMRSEGVRLPLYLGVPGVTELSKLMTIAARIGVANSARYLKKNRQMVGHLINPGSFGPDAFLEALGGTIADPMADVGGVHLFTFNQVEETAAWQQRMEARLCG